MKKIYYLFVSMLIIGMAFYSCTPEEQPGPEPTPGEDTTTITPGEDTTVVSEPPVIEIIGYTTTIEVAAVAGQVTFNYTLTNETEDGTVHAECPAEWVTGIDCGTKGTVVFTYEANDTEEQRETTLTLIYSYNEGEQVTDDVTILQAAGEPVPEYDHEFEASYADGEYYGDMFSFNGANNYYFMLSSLGWYYPNSEVYNFDIFAPEPTDMQNITLPAGRYTLGAAGETEEMTFTPDYSNYAIYNSDCSGYSVGPLSFTEGTLDVSFEGNTYICEAFLTDSNGETHHVTFSGTASFANYYEPEPEFLSTLQDDVEADMEGVKIDAFYYGEYYVDFGNYNWYLDIKNPSYTGDSFIIELQTPESDFSKGLPSHTYTASGYGEDWSFLTGYDYMGLEAWSWYRQYDEYGNFTITQKSPLSSGEIIITNNGDGTYTVIIDCWDDNTDEPHKITAEWTGAISMTDHSEYASNAPIKDPLRQMSQKNMPLKGKLLQF